MRDGDLGAGLVGGLFIAAVWLLLSGMAWAARVIWRRLTTRPTRTPEIESEDVKF
jgi:hypothetical protein